MSNFKPSGIFRRFVLCIFLLLHAGCAFHAATSEAGSAVTGSQIQNPAPLAGQMTQEELQAAVISYANRYIATIGQAAFDFEKKVPTKEGRLTASARKVYSLSAVTEIAAGPHPGASLLDLVVVSTLNRIVWEEYWRPQVFGMPAEIMIEAFQKMEDQALEMAARVTSARLTSRQKPALIIASCWPRPLFSRGFFTWVNRIETGASINQTRHRGRLFGK